MVLTENPGGSMRQCLRTVSSDKSVCLGSLCHLFRESISQRRRNTRWDGIEGERKVKGWCVHSLGLP